ncbi:MAG: hypothetical protein AABX79_02925 [Nanoarchaeota archaeon]
MKLSELLKPTKFKLILFVITFVILYIILFTIPITIPARVQCFKNPCPQEITTNLIHLLLPYSLLPDLIGGLFLPIIILLVISYLIASLIGYESGSKKDKRGLVTETLPLWAIALAVLVVLMITIFILREKGILLIEKIKDIFR